MSAERLQKVIARAGVASRRASERLIAEQRVTVNGRPARVGESVEEVDEIRVDGRKISGPANTVVIALHKPPGVVSSLNPQGLRRTVRDLVSHPGRLYPAGRLDKDSEGLIILTNDGDLALRLTHPRFGHEKEYRVRLDRSPKETELSAWRHGEGTGTGSRARAGPSARVVIRREESDAQGRWLRVILTEGRKRQIREAARAQGLEVDRLIRVRIGGLRLGRLAPGEWRVLAPSEVRALVSASRRGADRSGRPRETTKEARWRPSK